MTWLGSWFGLGLGPGLWLGLGLELLQHHVALGVLAQTLTRQPRLGEAVQVARGRVQVWNGHADEGAREREQHLRYIRLQAEQLRLQAE